MKMVKDSSSRQVTFSKRRTGLFKKANELATLCGAQVAIVVFSPGGKPFSFGHPNVDQVAERFLNQEISGNSGSEPVVPSESEAGNDEANGDDLNKELNRIQRQFEVERKRGEMMEKEIEAGGGRRFRKTAEEMSLEELLELKESLLALQGGLENRANEIEALSSLLLLSNDAARMEDSNDDQQ